MMTTTSNKRHTELDKPHWIEWATGLISALLVLAMIGFIGWEAMVKEDTPPEFLITVTGRTPVEGGYRVEFDIANKATETASAVVVRGEILDGSDVVEDADVTFDYVPAESKSSGAILFSQDPGAREVRISAVGYTEP